MNYDLDGNPINPTLYPQVLTGGAISALGVNVSASQVNFNNGSILNAKTWRAFTPKLGLSYQFTPTLFAFADFAKGFNAGGFNNRALNLATALPYDPETVKTYEAGIKSDWLDRHLRVNITGFYNDYSNLQTSVSVFSPVSGTYVSTRGNAPAAHTAGFELETSAQPIRQLALTFNTTYLETRYDDYASPALGSVAAYSYTGKQFSGQPKWQHFASATWSQPLAGRGTFKLGASGNYLTSYYSDALNNAQYRIAGHGYANAFASYQTEDQRWTFTLTARNLTNSFYFTSLSPVGAPLKSGPYAGTQLLQGAQNPPRTIFFKAAFAY